jgi:ADP-heptose:LPS heptosyltransferase
MMRVLALQLKRIGDVILTTPAIRALTEQGMRVTLLVDSGCASLLPAIAGADEKLIYHKRGGNGQLWRRLRADGWDAVLDFTGNDRSALMTWVSRASRRVTFDWVRARWWKRWIYREYVDSPVRTVHTCDHYLDLARSLGLPGDCDARPLLQVPDATNGVAAKLLKAAGIRGDFVLVHPGTARPEKYWAAERWAEVIANLRERGVDVAITSGPDAFEQHHVREVMLGVETSGRTMTGAMALLAPADLLELGAVVARARLVLSCDTSVVHFAAAFQRPQVALFGPTNPYHWRPRHEGVAVLSAACPEGPLSEFQPKMKGAPMQALPVLPVWTAAERLWLHSPLASASGDKT